MLNDEVSNRLAAQVRTGQIIIAALVAGCLAFLAAAGWKYIQQQAALDPNLEDNTLLFLSFAIPPIIARFFVPNLMATAARRRLAADRSLTGDALATSLIGVFQTRTIIAGALLEGAAMIAIFAFFQFSSPVALVAAAAIVFGLTTGAPKYDRAEVWLEEQLKAVQEDRALNP